MRRWLLFGLLLLCGPAWADSGILLYGVSNRQFPLDGFPSASVAYSFRKLQSAYNGSAIRIRRASDLAELDIGFLGYVPGLGMVWDAAAATAHCASTTCAIVIWYDQSGNGRNLAVGSFTTFPALVISCAPNGVGCSRIGTITTQGLQSVPASPATGVATLSVVANRRSGTTGFCNWRQNAQNNRLGTTATSGSWALTGGSSGSITATGVTEAAWHAGIGVINGASSSLTIDGTATTGTATGNTTSGGAQILLTGVVAGCDLAEYINWDNVALSAGAIAAWTVDQRSFWGF